MDMNLPVLNGYLATREIKKMNPDMCIIAQTAYAMAEDISKAYEAGCDDYLIKPIDSELLFEKLTEKFHS